MIEAKIWYSSSDDRTGKMVHGRTLESIARTYFGRKAELREESGTEGYRRFKIVRPDRNESNQFHVLGSMYHNPK